MSFARRWNILPDGDASTKGMHLSSTWRSYREMLKRKVGCQWSTTGKFHAHRLTSVWTIDHEELEGGKVKRILGRELGMETGRPAVCGLEGFVIYPGMSAQYACL